MKIDYDVGDVVVKVDGIHGINIGKLGRVTEIIETRSRETGERGLGIKLKGWGKTPVTGAEYWWAGNFKKLPKADEDFTAYMRKMKPKQTEKPRCPLTGEPLTVQERFEQECG